MISQVNEWLVSKLDNGGAWWVLMVLGASVGFGLGLAFIGLSYYYFAPDNGCHLNLFFITWSLVVVLLLVGVLFIPRRAPTAGLLTSGAVFLYTSFLLYSALHSEPPGGSCIRDGGGSSSWVQVCRVTISTAYY